MVLVLLIEILFLIEIFEDMGVDIGFQIIDQVVARNDLDVSFGHKNVINERKQFVVGPFVAINENGEHLGVYDIEQIVQFRFLLLFICKSILSLFVSKVLPFESSLQKFSKDEDKKIRKR